MRKLRKAIIWVLIILLVYVFLPLPVFNADEIEYEVPAQVPVNLGIEAGLALVVCAKTGHIIYAHGDPHQLAFPASMTKVMTALLLLESGAQMDDIIFHSHEAIFGFNRQSSHLYMSVGETLTVSQALHAIMLPSANDVSNAIAEFVAGDLETFAAMMTARAHQLGAVNTNFVNAHGLPHSDQVTTPYDMHLIMREAIRHEKFLEVAGTPRFIIPPTELQPDIRIINNTNLMVRPTYPQFMHDIVGGKTGWTTPSGHTLVSYGSRGGIGLISVVMVADRREAIFNDTRTLMNHGFEQFEEHVIFETEYFERTIDLTQRGENGVKVIGTLPLTASRDIILQLPNFIDLDEIQKVITLPSRIAAPAAPNFPVGRITVTYGERVLDTIPIATLEGGTRLSEDDFTALSAELPPQNQGMLESRGLHENFTFPSWLTDRTTLTYIIFAVLGLILIIGIAKLLKFGKKRHRYLKPHSNKNFKSHIAKNYKYR